LKTVKKRSQTQERNVAKLLDARPTAASGALWGMKGDVRNDKFLVECKTTQNMCYGVTTKVWEKIEEEATKDHMRIPLLVVDLQDKDRYVIFKLKYFTTKIDVDEYECEYNNCMTFRVCNTLSRITEFALKGSKRPDHNLLAMRWKDFAEKFKEEIF